MSDPSDEEVQAAILRLNEAVSAQRWPDALIAAGWLCGYSAAAFWGKDEEEGRVAAAVMLARDSRVLDAIVTRDTSRRPDAAFEKTPPAN